MVKVPNVLSRRLNQIRSNLLEGLGIEVTIIRAELQLAETVAKPIPPI
jgi:hypothetical protein